MGIKDLGDGRFKIDLRIGGRRGPRMRKTVEGMSAEQAKTAYRDLQASAKAVGPLAAGATVRDGFIHARTVRWEGTRALRSIEEDYGILTQFIPEATPLSQVGTTEINATIIGLRQRGLKDQTINHKLSVLRVIFKEGCKATPPLCHAVPRIPLLKPNRRLIRKPLNEQQEAEFIAWVAQKHADPAKHPREGEKWQLVMDLIVFLVDAGCRLSEALRVIERDIDLKEGMVRVWENKADKPRSQPMTPRVKAMIERRMTGRWNSQKREARLFAGKAKKTLQQAFKTARDSLGFGPETVLHSLRHTCATRLIQRNVDVRVVKEYMGHRRIETTMGYTHVAEAQIRAAAAALAPTSTGTGCELHASVDNKEEVN